MSTPRYPAEPFPPSMIAAVTADRDARLARWAADHDQGWTITILRPVQLRRHFHRFTPAFQNWKATGERYGQRVVVEGATAEIAERKLRAQLGLPLRPEPESQLLRIATK